jgi:ABC-type siderophore export system fused ATPase/permease subunit
MTIEQPTPQPTVDGLTQRLQNIKAILTLENINVLIPFFMFLLVGSMVVFGYFWKQMFVLKVILVTIVILLALLMAARHFWYPQELFQKAQKHTKKEPGIMDSIAEVIPSSADYEKNMEKAFKI